MSDNESYDAAFDPSRPNLARVYDYWLDGKDNYAADREFGDKITAALPGLRLGVRAQRAVLGRVVRYLVGEAGIRQLIDVGSGLPPAENVHEIAQRIDPATRVAYVDNDPVVLAHARALLVSNPATIAIGADLRDPAGILGNQELRQHLDWDQPVGLLLCGILHHILDEEQPGQLVRALRDALPQGSYVFIHHLLDLGDPAIADVQEALRQGIGRGQFRTMAEIESFFTGLELVEPGLVAVPEWRPDARTVRVDRHPVLRLACVGVARKV